MPCVNLRKRSNRCELIDEWEVKEEFCHFVDGLNE
jgi:hypothetical protein